ncbi:MAG: ribosomal protein S18-alanine N-acetyltransferase, partial [Sutterellaceae bacterium]|nr:ribosomal protein S18-alanine N-acetyltransferase [Sutterellaceae bacterium]
IRNFQDALAGGYQLTLATVDNVILGYAVTMQVIDEAELLEIAVDPVYQGNGYGKTLLKQAISQVKTAAARVMHLEVRESNERARKMYSSAGFVEVGKRRNYYPCETGREDAVLMTLTLVSE